MVRLLFEDQSSAELVLVRDSNVPAGWSLLGMSRGIADGTARWRADYGRRVLAMFKDFRIQGQEGNGVPADTFDVSFTWSRIQVGLPLDKQLFVPEAPLPRPRW